MDRIEFSQSVKFANDNSDVVQQIEGCMPGIVQFFDQTMGLYNIIGDKKCYVVAKSPNKVMAVYNLEMATEEDAAALMHDLQQQPLISIYGNQYAVSCSRLHDRVVEAAVTVMM